ncbi:hypothetical protein [Niabella drilacis]|uniref:Uncharacterized protein n=1 Tax=Niabella drilacis (strain DSM 25811 / CCM 8410 / CCUG 62505 / LMG 26954 / E90) TaxID=1285928 RepID=A0A1G6LH42_NIADE|nr:hypothetical protein [Niabella drilacis]SDC42570.1 hypothetical protein SAMN04487894_102348 [Niabella drilacis]
MAKRTKSAVKKAASKTATKAIESAKVKKQISNTDLPRKTLEECLDVARPIHETYADSNVSWDEIAAALSRGSQTAAFKYLVWGAQAYGLILRDGEAYQLTETSRKIFAPESEAERRESLIKASTIPTILSRFYTDYNGKFLPEGEFFDNILNSRYSIPKDRINEAKDIILSNARYCGLLIEHDSGKMTIRLEGAPIRNESQPEISIQSEIDNGSSEIDSENICFYITPIGDEGTEVRRHADMLLKHLIEPAFAKFNYKVIRADKIEKSGLISQQIFEYLVSCKICVADLSYGNPNAFYELGIRHMIKKPSIQIIRKGDKIPFDVSQGRTITVDISDTYTVMDKIESAKNELMEHIKAILDPSSSGQSDDNPVAVYLPKLTIRMI